MERDRHLVLYLNSLLVWLLAPHWCVLPSYFISSHWWDQLACDVGRYILTGRQTLWCVSGTCSGVDSPGNIGKNKTVRPTRKAYTKLDWNKRKSCFEGVCHSRWSHTIEIKNNDLEMFKAGWRKERRKEHTGCKGNLDFGAWRSYAIAT